MKVDPQMNLWLLLKFPWSLYWSGQTEWKDPNSAEATRENLKTQTHRITPNVIYYDGRLSNELYCEWTDWETPGFTTNHWLTVINHVWRHQRLLELNTWIKITSEPNWSHVQLPLSVSLETLFCHTESHKDRLWSPVVDGQFDSRLNVPTQNRLMEEMFVFSLKLNQWWSYWTEWWRCSAVRSTVLQAQCSDSSDVGWCSHNTLYRFQGNPGDRCTWGTDRQVICVLIRVDNVQQIQQWSKRK